MIEISARSDPKANESFIIGRGTSFLLPLAIYLCSWLVLTVLGAVIFEIYPNQLWKFLGLTVPVAEAGFSSADYLVFLGTPFVLVPAGMVLGWLVARFLLGRLQIGWYLVFASSTKALYAILFLGIAYTIYKLETTGHLVPRLLFKEMSFDEKMVERARIISDLHFVFYAVVYAIIPITACIFFAKIIMERSISCLIGLIISFIALYYLNICIYMKAPLVIFFVELAITVILIRASLLYIPVLAAAAIVTFLSMQALLGGIVIISRTAPEMKAAEPAPRAASAQGVPSPKKLPDGLPKPNSDAVPKAAPAPRPGAAASNPADKVASAVHPSQPKSVPSAKVSTPPPAAQAPRPGATAGNPADKVASAVHPSQPKSAPSANVSTPPPAAPSFAARFEAALLRTPENVVFRMASSYPFYLGIFRDPAQRCGIETNHLPLLPTPACDLPTKVFKQMYPSIKDIQGFAPAAAHVSAYGEIGPWYAIFILLVSGLSLGILAAISATGKGLVFVGLNLATCIYAYYLTQVPFLGALTYAHGLLFLVAPLVFVAVWDLLSRRVGKRQSN